MGSITLDLGESVKTFTIKPVPRMGMVNARVAYYRDHVLFKGLYGHLYAHRDFPTDRVSHIGLKDPATLEALAVCLQQLEDVTEAQCQYLLAQAAEIRKRNAFDAAAYNLRQGARHFDIEEAVQQALTDKGIPIHDFMQETA